ncbi:MAG TPA: Amuc_1100 family pilus-like protein, partial [Verrucomicrobiae bacterium]|nr:Amuc_1100 family pilus-like protein [Verrucomicrobiae bacterium]
ADRQGIRLPDKDYWFSFAPERTATEFKSIGMLTHELWDVKELCEIMYAAKVHDMKGIRRVPASSDDNNQTDFITDKKASTNDLAIVTPYEIKFQGFSTELAHVLEGLVSAKHCFVVRNVAVDKAPPEEAQAAAAPPINPMMMMNPRYFNRYTPPPPPAGVAPQHRPGNVLLDENKLLVILQIDAVRLKDVAKPKPAAAERAKQVAQAQQ